MTPGANPLIDGLIAMYSVRGQPWEEANIIGIRAAKDFYTNKFLDLLAVATDTKLIVLRATTVPGPYWTPENCKKMGIAYASIICPGYMPKAYGFTNHQGHPPKMALGQRKPIMCWRDTNRNSVMDETPYAEAASAGMNIHTQKPGDTDEAVNFASAGCQVAQNRALFLDEFMPTLHATEEAKKGDAARFSYMIETADGFPFTDEFFKLAR